VTGKSTGYQGPLPPRFALAFSISFHRHRTRFTASHHAVTVARLRPSELDHNFLVSVSGTFQVYDPFQSDHVADRRVDVWLPPGYRESAGRRYPVIYAHDGQNLFDEATAFVGVDWGIDEAIIRLMSEDVRYGAIVVGIWNTSARIQEFMPQKPLQLPNNDRIRRRFSERYGGEPISDAYLKFIVDELKPVVDRDFQTEPGPDSTLVLGSSMGGLVSLYGICEYPDVFGTAVCMSTSWTVGGKPTLAFLRSGIPAPGKHVIYFDHGNEAQIGAYEKLQHAVDVLFATSGYRRDVDFMSLRFDGADHSEVAWRDRVEVPLRFALRPGRRSPLRPEQRLFAGAAQDETRPEGVEQ
jgi:predicted alpha/beta superfamily hydrolase